MAEVVGSAPLLSSPSTSIFCDLNCWIAPGRRATVLSLLFVVTALAEIIGCYLPYLWLRQGKSPWLLVPAGVSLAVFAWLLSFHPTAAGRVYAAYGGVYISVALVWLWAVDGVQPQAADYAGVALCLVGMTVIMFAPR